MTTSKNQIIKEILVTIFILAVYRLMVMIPMPFIDYQEFSSMFGGVGTLGRLFHGNSDFSYISITALGLIPYCSAYMLIEILSLSLPVLKKHRNGDYSGRVAMRKYALGLTLILSAVQSYFIIQGLKSMVSPYGVPILTLSGNFQFLTLLLTMVASVFFLLFLAEVVTRHGIGNGISLFIFSGICFGLGGNVLDFFDRTNELQLNYFYVIVFSVILAFLFILIPIILLKSSYTIPLKHSSDESSADFFKLNFCLSGKISLGLATSILMIPATLFSFMGGFEALATSLNPGSFFYYFFSCILILFLSYIFGWLFLHPGKRFRTFKQWGWELEENHGFSIDTLKRKFLLINLPWTLFLFALLVVPTITITGFNIPFFLGGTSLIIAAAISLDIVSRFRLWNDNVHDKTYKIAEFQDLHHATMIKNHLRNENIKFYLQGYYHRHLLYFFGPYIPIHLMVPLSERDRVMEIIFRYYGGLGLVFVGGRSVVTET